VKGPGAARILRDFTSASHEGIIVSAHSCPNGSDGPKNKGGVR
jgi:hypothetical protein